MAFDRLFNLGFDLVSAISILLLVSIGLAVIFGMRGIINLAHGEFIMLGAFATLSGVRSGLNVWLAMLIATMAVGAFGIVLERLLIRRLYGRLFDTMLATWGVSLILVQVVDNHYGSVTEGIPVPVGSFTVGDFSMSTYNVILMGAGRVSHGGHARGDPENALRTLGASGHPVANHGPRTRGQHVFGQHVDLWAGVRPRRCGRRTAGPAGRGHTHHGPDLCRPFVHDGDRGRALVHRRHGVGKRVAGFGGKRGHQPVHPGDRAGHAAHRRNRHPAVHAPRAHRKAQRAMMSRATRLIGSGARSVRGSVRTDLSVAGLALVAAAILGNLVEEFTAFEWSLWAIQAILALSLVLIWGYGGIFSFGQAAAYGIGGYTYGFWAINVADNTGETLTALLAAVVVGAAFAGLLGYFMFYGNVTNVYIAIITLATSLVLFAFVNSTSGSEYRIGDAPFGGYNGMTRIPRLTWRLPGGTSHELTRVQFFVVCVAAGLLIAVGIRVLSRRPFGRVAVAMQHNELRTELTGYNVRAHKLALFTIGGGIAAFAGALFAAWGRFISPPVFSLTPAALVVIWVLVGSRSSVAGAFIGVLTVEGLSSWAGGSDGNNEPIVLGAILIFIVLFLPGGVIANAAKAWAFVINRAASQWPPAPQPPTAPTTTQVDQFQPAAETATPMLVWMTDTNGERSNSPIATRMVTKRFGGLTAVDNVTLEFPALGVSCLIGPNGAGKSTLFGLLSGQYGVTEGSVLLDEQNLTKWPAYQRARHGIGVKLQVASIYKELSVQENLWLACYAMPRHAASAMPAPISSWSGFSSTTTRKSPPGRCLTANNSGWRSEWWWQQTPVWCCSTSPLRV